MTVWVLPLCFHQIIRSVLVSNENVSATPLPQINVRSRRISYILTYNGTVRSEGHFRNISFRLLSRIERWTTKGNVRSTCQLKFQELKCYYDQKITFIFSSDFETMFIKHSASEIISLNFEKKTVNLNCNFPF